MYFESSVARSAELEYLCDMCVTAICMSRYFDPANFRISCQPSSHAKIFKKINIRCKVIFRNWLENSVNLAGEVVPAETELSCICMSRHSIVSSFKALFNLPSYASRDSDRELGISHCYLKTCVLHLQYANPSRLTEVLSTPAWDSASSTAFSNDSFPHR